MIVNLSLSLLMQSCYSHTKKIEQIPAARIVEAANPFDLADLTFKDDINDLLKLNGVSFS